MKVFVIGLSIATTALGASVAGLNAQTPSRNVWDGVYTAEQAAQGKAAFDTKCAICHGPELMGAEMAPALAGGMFLGNWSSQSVGGLFRRIKATMPASDPGSLSNAETVQIVSYILSVNRFPAGSTTLPNDEAALGQIAITAGKPAAR